MYDLCCIGIVVTRKRKRHSEEDKRAAVKLWKSGDGMSLAEVEQRTGVAATNVRRYSANPEEKTIRLISLLDLFRSCVNSFVIDQLVVLPLYQLVTNVHWRHGLAGVMHVNFLEQLLSFVDKRA
jgi:hypothetical protein